MQLPAALRRSPIFRYPPLQTGSLLLLAASLIVGVAIASPDPFSRAINGVSGLLWFAGAGFLLVGLRDDPRFCSRLALVATIGMILVLAVRPSDLLMAIIGFGLAGGVIAARTAERGTHWATLLAALWLPEHLLTAVARSIYRAVRDQPATLRSEPPPTAALVPFAMVVAAWGAGWLVSRYWQRTKRLRRDESRDVSSAL